MEMSIYEKLLKIQQNLNAPKSQHNDFGKYNYRSCEDILAAVKPLLRETKTVLLITDAVVTIGGRIYIKATATLADTEENATVQVDGFAREEEAKKGMDASQVTGASSSYARKYALNGLFAIDDNKDSDATNTGDSEQKPVKREEKKAPRQAPPPPDVYVGPHESADGFYYCDSCGQTINPVTDKYGKTMTPRDLVAVSIAKFGGRQLCADCMKNERKAG